MKLTRFPQSCLLIKTDRETILVDPGNIDMKDEYYPYFETADYILVTHKHQDHCFDEVIQNLMHKKQIPLYSTNEVKQHHPSLEVNLIKENDIIDLGKTKIEVVHAEHGYIPPMKTGAKVNENVGFIIDDGEKRIYITSDTICFQNEYKCDVLCVSISDYGVTMGAFEAGLFAKETQCDLVLPIHLDNPKYPINYEFVDEQMKQAGVNYKILQVLEEISI